MSNLGNGLVDAFFSCAGITVFAAATDWSAVGAIVGIASFALAVGAVVGRVVLTQLHERDSRRKAEAKRHEDDQAIRLALVGKPKTEFTDASPGLIEITRDLQKGHLATNKAVRELQAEMVEHRREDVELAEQFHTHLHGHAENGRSS